MNLKGMSALGGLGQGVVQGVSLANTFDAMKARDAAGKAAALEAQQKAEEVKWGNTLVPISAGMAGESAEERKTFKSQFGAEYIRENPDGTMMAPRKYVNEYSKNFKDRPDWQQNRLDAKVTKFGMDVANAQTVVSNLQKKVDEGTMDASDPKFIKAKTILDRATAARANAVDTKDGISRAEKEKEYAAGVQYMVGTWGSEEAVRDAMPNLDEMIKKAEETGSFEMLYNTMKPVFQKAQDGETMLKDAGVTETGEKVFRKKDDFFTVVGGELTPYKGETFSSKPGGAITVAEKQTRAQSFISNFGSASDRLFEITPKMRLPRLKGWLQVRGVEEKLGNFTTGELDQIEQTIMSGLITDQRIQDNIKFLRSSGATVKEIVTLTQEEQNKIDRERQGGQ